MPQARNNSLSGMTADEIVGQAASAVREMDRRSRELLRCYRPMPTQLSFHNATARENICRGGKRCLGGEQPIYDPVLGVSRPVSQIMGEFHVIALDPATGAAVVAKASAPFIKGYGDLYEVTFSDGTSMVTTLEHRVVNAAGEWTSIAAAYEAGQALPCLAGDAQRQVVQDGVLHRLGGNQSSRRSWSVSLSRKVLSGARRLATETSKSQRAVRCDAAEALWLHSRATPRSTSRLHGPSFLPRAGEASRQSATFGAAYSLLRQFVACHPQSTSAPVPSIRALGALRFAGTIADSQSRCSDGRRPCDGQLRLEEAVARCAAPSLNDARERIHLTRHLDAQAGKSARTQFCRSSDHPSSLGESGLPCTLASEQGYRTSSATSELFAKHSRHAQQSLPSSASRPNTTRAELHELAFALTHPLGFRNVDRLDTVTITALRWIRKGAIWDLTVEHFANYCTGVFSANSGKTLSVACEFSSAVTGIPLTGPDGKPLPFKYPRRPLLAWIIGWDEAHIGQTLHRVLFEPGYVRVIKDLTTGQWRIWNAADPMDAARESETKPSEPLIPSRLIDEKSWAWENRRERIFNSVRLTNGTKICAYPSTAQQAKQGDAVDIIWIDEDVRFAEHVKEWQDRLSTNRGWLLWSVWPHTTNNALLDMHKRAEEQKDWPAPFVHETVLRFTDNPFVTPEAKAEAINRMGTEEERRARDYGEFVLSNVLMYHWNAALHGIPNSNSADRLNQLWEHEHAFPLNWTRYLALDPGWSTCAVLLGVVPPPEYGRHLIIEDEVYFHHKTADEVAKALAEKMAGKAYEAFIIDNRAGRQTPLAGGPKVAEQYAAAFERNGLISRQSGHGFLPGSDNVDARTGMVREWMRRDDDGQTILRFVLTNTRWTQDEFGKYKRKIGRDDTTDKVVDANNHAMNALEYLVMFDPQHVPASESLKVMPPRVKAFYDFMAHLGRDNSPGAPINLGPPAAVA